MRSFKFISLLLPLVSFSQDIKENFLKDDRFRNKNIFFHHIPKTAGTSTIHFLRKVLNKDKLLDMYVDNLLQKQIVKTDRKLLEITGLSEVIKILDEN